MPGETDLATTHPELAAQLVDQTLATKLMAGSSRKVGWRCEQGHEWETTPALRTRAGTRRATGCPWCNGKPPLVAGVNDLETLHPQLCRELVQPELGSTVGAGSARKLKWKCPAGHLYTASVYNRVAGTGCPICDGKAVLAGFNDLATTNPDVAALLVDQSLATRLAARSNRKVRWRCEQGHEWNAVVASRRQSGCPFCAGRRAIPGETDLATSHPHLAAELVDMTLATSLKAGSDRVVDWRGATCGHVWRSSVATRTSVSEACPYCSGRRTLTGFNDLATTHPEVAVQLVDQSLATVLRAGSNRKVLWSCAKHHRWVTSPNQRTRVGKQTGCPECAPSGFSQVAPAWLYLLATPGRVVYKVGITNDLDGRLAAHALQGFTEVVETLFYEVGTDALAAETKILRHARELGWEPPLTASSMPKGGASETLSADDVGDSFTLSGFLAEHSD